MRLVLQPWDRHKFLLGTEYRDDPHRDQKNVTPDPYFLVLDNEKQKTSYAGYVQDEWSITPHTIASISVRHDGSDEDIRATSPRLATMHRFGASTVGKFLYGTAFRPPNAYEKYYFADAGTYKANLNLRHEKIKTMEWILDRAVGIRSRLTASFFTYRIENLIALTVDPADSFFVFENVDRARARGLQLEWEYELTSQTRLRASMTWQRAEDELTKQPLVNSPRRLAKATMAWPFGPIWHGGFEVQHVAERTTPFDGEVPEYTIANFTLHSGRLWERAEIRWSIYNLADVAYFDSPSEEHVDSLGRNLTEIRQDGRRYLASVVLTF